MLIDKKSGWARVYFWSLDILGEFTGNKYSRERTNLCQLFRTIFVYTPLVLFLNLLFWAAVVCFLFVSPVIMYGTWMALVWQSGIIIAMALAIWAGVCLVERYQQRRDRCPEVVLRKQKPQVIRRWLKAKKERICPLIEFVDSEGKESGGKNA